LEEASGLALASTLEEASVHPLVELDFSKQIPGRSDLRQMGKWQKSVL